MTQEELKLAHEALEYHNFAIAAIKEALAQPEQESVAWEQLHEHIAGPFYTHQPQRPWLGLTENEIEELFQTATGADEGTVFRFAAALQAKLKGRNT